VPAKPNRIYGNSQDVSVTGFLSNVNVNSDATVVVVREGGSVSQLVLRLPEVRESHVGRMVRVLRPTNTATTLQVQTDDATQIYNNVSAGSVQNVELHLTTYNGGQGTWKVVLPDTDSVDEVKPLNVIVLNYDDCGRHQMPTYADLNSWPAGIHHLYPQMPWTKDRSGSISDQGTEAGTRFTQGRVAARCTPTRQCLATGRQPHLSQNHPWGTRVGNIPQQGGVSPEFRTITGVTREEEPFPVVAKRAGAPHYFFHIGKVHASEWEIRDADSDYVALDGFGSASDGKADENRRNYKQILADYGFDEAYKLELAKPDGNTAEPYRGYKGTWSGDGSDTVARDARTFSAYHLYSNPAQGASGWSVASGAKVGSKTLPVTGGSGTFKRGDKLRVAGMAQELIVWEDSESSPTEITLYEGLQQLPAEGASITLTFHIVGDDIETGEEYGGGELGGQRRAGFTESDDPGQAGATLILQTGDTLTPQPDLLTSAITINGTQPTHDDEDPYYLTYELTKIKECIEACADRGKPFYIQWWTNAPHGNLPAMESNLGPAWSRVGVAADGTTYFFTESQYTSGVTSGQNVATGMHRDASSTTGLTFSAAEVEAMCKRYLRTYKDEVVDGIDVSDPQHPLIQQGIYATGSLDGQIRTGVSLWTRDTRFTVGGGAPSTETANFGPGYDADGNVSGGGLYGPLGAISVSFRRMIAQLESIDRGCQMLDDWLQVNYPEVHANTIWVIHSDNGPTEADSQPRRDSWQSLPASKQPAYWAQLQSSGTGVDWTNYTTLPPYEGGYTALSDNTAYSLTGNDDSTKTYHNPAHSKNRVNDDGLLTHLSIWGYNLHEGGNDTACYTDATDFYKSVLDLIAPGCYEHALTPELLHYASDSASFIPAMLDTTFQAKETALYQIYKPSGGLEGALTQIERCVIDTTGQYKLLRRYESAVVSPWYGTSAEDPTSGDDVGIVNYRLTGGVIQLQFADPSLDIEPMEDGERVTFDFDYASSTTGTLWADLFDVGTGYVKKIADGDGSTEGAILELYLDPTLTTPISSATFTASTFTPINTGTDRYYLRRDEYYTTVSDEWYLFDLNADPRETNNLYGQDGYDNVVSSLRKQYRKQVGNLD
jgi:hypothetical protein